jgi:hypothetical protein
MTLDFVLTVAVLTTLSVAIAHFAPRVWQRSQLRARWMVKERRASR